jgi:transcriptional regulator with XRE-family HTH domain
MHERIKQIIDNEGLSVRKFEDKIHCSVGVIARALKNKTDISSRFLISIKEVFPQYSAEWLLTGEGEMLVSKEGEDGVSSAEECKQTDDGEENISRRLDDMEKRETQRDFLLNRIADTLEGISKILAHLPENPEKESGVKNNSSLCG